MSRVPNEVSYQDEAPPVPTVRVFPSLTDSSAGVGRPSGKTTIVLRVDSATTCDLVRKTLSWTSQGTPLGFDVGQCDKHSVNSSSDYVLQTDSVLPSTGWVTLSWGRRTDPKARRFSGATLLANGLEGVRVRRDPWLTLALVSAGTLVTANGPKTTGLVHVAFSLPVSPPENWAQAIRVQNVTDQSICSEVVSTGSDFVDFLCPTPTEGELVSLKFMPGQIVAQSSGAQLSHFQSEQPLEAVEIDFAKSQIENRWHWQQQ
jgi:hypothetical protein